MNSGKPIAIVSGASEGLGRELAAALANSGYNLSLCGRNSERLQTSVELCRSLGAQVHAQAFDITNMRSLEKFVTSSADHWGRFDCLVNNAGLNHFGTLRELSVEQISSVFDVNLRAAVLMTKLTLDRTDQLLIVNISSAITRFRQHRKKIPYALSKIALSAFSEALADEYEEGNINILNVVLGPTYTRFDRHSPAHERIRILGNAGIHRTEAELADFSFSPDEETQFFEKLGEWFLDPKDVARKIQSMMVEPEPKKYRELELRPAKG